MVRVVVRMLIERLSCTLFANGVSVDIQMATSGVVHGVFDAREVRLTLVMDAEFWQSIFFVLFLFLF